MAVSDEEEQQRKEDACGQLHAAAAPQPLGALHDDQSRERDEYEPSAENVGEGGPPRSRIVMQFRQRAPHGPPRQPFDDLSYSLISNRVIDSNLVFTILALFKEKQAFLLVFLVE